MIREDGWSDCTMKRSRSIIGRIATKPIFKQQSVNELSGGYGEKLEKFLWHKT